MEESRQQMALSRLKQMVTNFMAQPRCAPFCQPVDWKALGLDDYPEIIPSPMDLGTILQQLNNNNNSQYYTSAHACADHCKLVWNNALRYNLPHSPIWETARLFRRRFNDTWLQIRKDCCTYIVTRNGIRVLLVCFWYCVRACMLYSHPLDCFCWF